jgi:glycosyl hydrolase family 43
MKSVFYPARPSNKPNRLGLPVILFAILFLAAQVLGSAADAVAIPPGFPPGQVWRDTDGNPINAHGGGVLFHKGVYYWYGESKSGRTYLPDCNKSWGGTRVDLTGVSCYASTNLSDWKNEGIVLPAVPDDPRHDLHPSKVLERPKVIYNRATKQFVMWMHIDSTDYAAAQAGTAVSDKPRGPFKYLGSLRPDSGFWPENATENDKQHGGQNALARDFERGQMARDITLFVDDDGRAYLYYSSEENATMHVSLLTEDYLRTSGKYARIFVGRKMEAPAVFKRAGKYYLIASGCTAWEPNAACSAMADNPLGPWKELGNPCLGDDADTTFHSQSTFVLPVQGRPEAFMFIADRWNPRDLPASRYLWLPLEFDADGKPILSLRARGSLSAARDVVQPQPE